MNKKLNAAIWATLMIVCIANADLKGDMLLIESKLYPNIILYDKDIKDKLIEGAIVLSIISQDDKSQSAEKFRELVEKNFQGKIKEYKLETKIVSPKESESSKESALFICCECTDRGDIFQVISKKRVISFACDANGLKNGALIGIKIEKSVKPLINKKVLNQSGIRLDSQFLGFAEVYDE